MTTLENEQRNRLGSALALGDAAWETIYRVYLARYYGLGDECTWDRLWRTVWFRHIGKSGDCTDLQLRQALQGRRKGCWMDPCKNLATPGTLVGLEFATDDSLGFRGLHTFLEQLKSDYDDWRHYEIE